MTYENVLRDGSLGCSDCRPAAGEKEFLEQNIPDRQYLQFSRKRGGGWGGSSEVGGRNIASRDRRRIYYQKGYREPKVSLFEYDLDTNTDRELTSFESRLDRCVAVDDLTLSHDQRYVAFKVHHGCHFSSAPELWVFDRTKGTPHHVADAAYGDMHWLAFSNRLYFYSCAQGGACDENDHLSYVELE